jgi:hypothetical protein
VALLMNIEMTGYADVRADAKTVKDLRDLVSFLDENRVRDDAQIDWGSGYVYILVADNARADFIECGDHIPPANAYDVLIPTHGHGDPDKAPARFDWPAKDKTSSTWDEDDEDILCHFFRKHDDDNTYHRLHGNYYCTKCYARREDRYGDEARPE